MRPRPCGGLAPLFLRSSAVVPLTPGIVLLLVLNTVMRGHPWDHEWGWAIYQAGFVTVFLGPLCAGIGVWDGTQLARAQPVVEAAGRPTAARAAAWGAIVTVVGVVYLGLLVVLGAALKADGILGGPHLVDLSPIPGVIALCGAWAAIGVGIGYRWRTPLLAPIAAAGAFGVTLVLYLGEPLLIKVGGATGSILFLAPDHEVQAAQLLLYASITATALVGLPRRRKPGEPLGRWLAPAITPILALGALGWLIGGPTLEFRTRERPLVCRGQGPAICVAEPYRDRADWPRPYLEPYLDALADLDIPAPTTFSQAVIRDPGEGSIPDELLRGHPAEAGPYRSVGPGGIAVLGAYLDDSCDVFRTARVQAAYDLVDRWLASLTSPDVLDDPTVPAVLRTGSTEDRATALRAGFRTLADCR